MISRRDAVKQLAGLVTGAFAAPFEDQGPHAPASHLSSPPNIVFVLMDDMRWDYMGCAGHPFIRTPHLDQLAREGARLTNAFVCLSLCSPSRASFLTGLYPQAHGVVDNRTPLDFSRLTTFPQRLQQAGYRTVDSVASGFSRTSTDLYVPPDGL